MDGDLEASTVPSVLACDLKGLSLDRLEAFVLSQIDGSSSLDELASLAGLPIGEVRRIVRRLHELGTVNLPGHAARRPSRDVARHPRGRVDDAGVDPRVPPHVGPPPDGKERQRDRRKRGVLAGAGRRQDVRLGSRGHRGSRGWTADRAAQQARAGRCPHTQGGGVGAARVERFRRPQARRAYGDSGAASRRLPQARWAYGDSRGARVDLGQARWPPRHVAAARVDPRWPRSDCAAAGVEPRWPCRRLAAGVESRRPRGRAATRACLREPSGDLGIA